MSIETADDRAVFFDADEFAHAAIYQPAAGGGSMPVTVVLDRPVERAELPGFLGVKGPARRARLRRDEVADPGVGDTVTIASLGETRTVKTFELDDTGEIWILDLQ